MEHHHNDLCKFHGKFTDLIPAGWKFQKLFASNYRQYAYEVAPYKHIRIWQHHGGYIELDSLYGASKQVIEAVLLNNFEWQVYPNLNGSYGFTIENETGLMIPQLREHDGMHAFFLAETKKLSPEEASRLADETYNKYTKHRIDERIMNQIRNMADKGWIKV